MTRLTAIQTPEEGATYWVARIGNAPVAGIFPTDRPDFAGVPVSWMSYLAVDDVDTRVRKAVDGGASLMRPIFDVPHVGRIAILTEPGGAGIGWMTPAGKTFFRIQYSMSAMS